MNVDDVSGKVVNAAYKVHIALGPGMLESAYEACLAHELRRNNLEVATQVNLPVVYEGMKLDVGYRLDILVEKCVIVELKAVEALLPVHTAQVLSYLKFSTYPIGLLINFNVKYLKDNIKRYVGDNYTKKA